MSGGTPAVSSGTASDLSSRKSKGLDVISDNRRTRPYELTLRLELRDNLLRVRRVLVFALHSLGSLMHHRRAKSLKQTLAQSCPLSTEACHFLLKA